MKNQEKKDYHPPRLAVVTFKVEQGFAESGVASYFNFTHLDEYDQEVGTTFGRTGYGQESESNQQSWF